MISAPALSDKPAYPTQGGSTGISLYEHATLEILKALISNPTYANNSPDGLLQIATKMSLLYMKEMNK